jgi:hypothetical protein
MSARDNTAANQWAFGDLVSILLHCLLTPVDEPRRTLQLLLPLLLQGKHHRPSLGRLVGDIFVRVVVGIVGLRAVAMDNYCGQKTA